VTHEYRILVGGTVIRGAGQPDATAIAWAGDTILAIGTDEEVRAISRGDSHVASLDGALVASVQPEGDWRWQPDDVLEVGGIATFAVLADDPRTTVGRVLSDSMLALVRAGRVVLGGLPDARL
jgi:hypothetical protein